jgi:hypothetical protein
LALVLGVAARTGSRRKVARELAASLAHRGIYAGSTEQLTPILRDPPSLVAIAAVAAQLVMSPRAAKRISATTVATYQIRPDSIDTIRNLPGG